MTSNTSQTLCLDSELELQHINHALGIEHLCSSSHSAYYYSLLNKCIGQEFHYEGKLLKIVEIVDRFSFAQQYVWELFRKSPQNFSSLTMINFNDTEGLINNIRRILKLNSATFEGLLKLYHFENNDWGLPIDVLCMNDYRQYLRIFANLLYAQDQALYGGDALYEDECNQVYIPDLSTLVLAFLLKIDKVLEVIKGDLLVPESYLAFIRNLLDVETQCGNNSVGSISLNGEQLIFNNPDEFSTSILNNILEFCQSCKILTISSEERSNFKTLDNYSCEQFFTSLNISLIHLDALILAKREHASLLCDDLFFRNMATREKIGNVNTPYVIMHLNMDMDFVMSLVITFSKTNYLGVPIFPRDTNEYNQLFDNLMYGIRKKRFYGPRFKRYYNDNLIHLK